MKRRKNKRKIMISPTLVDRGNYEPNVWIKGDYNPHRGIFRLDLNDAIKKASNKEEEGERSG